MVRLRALLPAATFNPALRAAEESTSAVARLGARRCAIKRIFVATNLERLRLGATFLFREIARARKKRQAEGKARVDGRRDE